MGNKLEKILKVLEKSGSDYNTVSKSMPEFIELMKKIREIEGGWLVYAQSPT